MQGFYSSDDLSNYHQANKQDFARKPDVISDYDIVGITNKDSLGSTEDWKKFVNVEKLKQTWGVSDSSPWKAYEQLGVFDLLNNYPGNLALRHSTAENRSEEFVEIYKKTLNPRKDNRHMIILDSGGPHSIAMATKLAAIGYQPVVLMPEQSFVKQIGALGELATFLYYSKEIEKLRENMRFTEDSPPAFIMDTHRNDSLKRHSFINLPSKAELLQYSINNVLYVNEYPNIRGLKEHWYGDQKLEGFASDIKPFIKDYEANDHPHDTVQVLMGGFDPWPFDH